MVQAMLDQHVKPVDDVDYQRRIVEPPASETTVEPYCNVSAALSSENASVAVNDTALHLGGHTVKLALTTSFSEAPARADGAATPIAPAVLVPLNDKRYPCTFFSACINLFTLIIVADMFRRSLRVVYQKAPSASATTSCDEAQQEQQPQQQDDEVVDSGKNDRQTFDDAGLWDEADCAYLSAARYWSEESDDEVEEKLFLVDPLAAYIEAEAQELLPTASKEALLKLIRITAETK
jgi:hypothetical protein